MAEKNTEMQVPGRTNRSSSVPGVMDDSGLETIRTNHNEAYVLVAQGLSYEENNQPQEALDCYQQGLTKLEKALLVRCDRPYCVGEKWDSARQMQNKMRRTVQEVRTRLNALSNKLSKPTSLPNLDRPPSYEEACAAPSISSPVWSPHGIGNLAAVHEGYELGAAVQSPTDSALVEEIFTVSNVHMFHVAPDGNVSATNESTTLHVFKFVNFDRRHPMDNRPPVWLQIGEWSYPLVPGQSPVLSCEYGAFIFPDVSSSEKGTAVGVILPYESDSGIHDIFESLLAELTQVQPEALPLSAPVPPSDERTAQKISKGIVAGAKWVSFGLVKGAEMAVPLVNKGANMLRERIQPEGRPRHIDPRVKQGIAVLKDATGTARKVTGSLVSKLGSLTMAMAKELAPHVRKHGTRLVSSALPMNPNESQSAVDDVMIVAAGGLQGFATVYTALEQAAKTLAYSLSQETVKVVDHKYGSDAGDVVNNALYSVGNLALTAHNVQSLGVKAIAKRTAKDMGKTVLHDYIEKVDKQGTNSGDNAAASSPSFAPSTSTTMDLPQNGSILNTPPPAYKPPEKK